MWHCRLRRRSNRECWVTRRWSFVKDIGTMAPILNLFHLQNSCQVGFEDGKDASVVTLSPRCFPLPTFFFIVIKTVKLMSKPTSMPAQIDRHRESEVELKAHDSTATFHLWRRGGIETFERDKCQRSKITTLEWSNLFLTWRWLKSHRSLE